MPYVRTRLGRWFFEEHGAPRQPGDATILLSHGLLFDSGMWREQIGPLAKVGRVVCLDGPGHGRSEAPPRFTLEDHADALLDVFAELGIARVVHVGLSWGGMVAMRLAVQHPDRVRALGLLDTSAEAEGLKNRIRYRALIALSRRVGLPRPLIDREIAPLMYTRQTLVERPELLDEFTRAVNGYPRDGMARAALATVVHRTDILGKIGGIGVPTVVFCGREDRATPPAKSEAIARTIPRARLVWVEACGHMSAIERPDAVNEVLVPFVRAHIAAA
jgi:pimeloyl-ACP methyl ester carboxylesterase